MKDKNLDNLFTYDKNKTEDILKEARTKSNIRIMGISFSILILTLVLASILKLQITPMLVDKKTTAITLYNNIYGANTSVSNWNETYKLFGSTATAKKYKLIDGIPYTIGELNINESEQPYKLNMGTGEDWTTYQDAETYSSTGEHIMKFYHPELEYNNYKNDLEKLDKISSDKKIEMAISFDKTYTLEEIKQMLPENITWNWSWVNTFDDNSINGIKEFDNDVTYSPNIILEEDEVIGFSMLNQIGELKENPIDDFIYYIQRLAKNGEIEAKNISKTLTNNNVSIIGIVVSGEREELLQLKDKPFIKASSLGVITEVY